MIVNSVKFKAMIFGKCKGNPTNQIIDINHKEIKAVSNFKLLLLDIDNKLNSNTI